MAKKRTAELYRQDRETGMTYQQIAQKYGVSRQRVGQACGKQNPARFRPIDRDSCVYPNLRAWMNRHKVCKTELLRRCGLGPVGTAAQMMGRVLRGEQEPRKRLIDQLIRVTGLDYNDLWEEDPECGG